MRRLKWLLPTAVGLLIASQKIAISSPAAAWELVDWSSVTETLEKTLREALQAVQRIEDKSERLVALSRLVEAMVKLGEKQKAIAVSNQALLIAQRVRNTKRRSLTLFDAARVMAEAGLSDQVLQVA